MGRRFDPDRAHFDLSWNGYHSVMPLWILESGDAEETEVPDPLSAQFYYSDIWLKDRGLLILSDNEKEILQKVYSECLPSKHQDEFSASAGIKQLINHAPLVSSIHDSIWLCPPNSLLLFPEREKKGTSKSSSNSHIVFKTRFKKIDVDLELFVYTLINQYSLQVSNKRVVHIFISAGFDSRLELALLMLTCSRNCEIILHSFLEDVESTSVVRDIAQALKLNLIMHDMKEQTQRGIEINQIIASITESSNWRPSIPAYAGVISEYLGKENNSVNESFFGFTPYEFKGRYFELAGKYQGQRLRFISNPESTPEMQTRQIELQKRLLKNYINCSPFKEDYRTIDFLNWSLSYTNSYSHRNRILGKMGLINLTSRSEIAELFFNLPRHMKERNNLILECINYLAPTLASIQFISSSDNVKSRQSLFRDLKTRNTGSQDSLRILNSILSKKISTIDSELDLSKLNYSNWSESQRFSFLQVEYFKNEVIRTMSI